MMLATLGHSRVASPAPVMSMARVMLASPAHLKSTSSLIWWLSSATLMPEKAGRRAGAREAGGQALEAWGRAPQHAAQYSAAGTLACIPCHTQARNSPINATPPPLPHTRKDQPQAQLHAQASIHSTQLAPTLNPEGRVPKGDLLEANLVDDAWRLVLVDHGAYGVLDECADGLVVPGGGAGQGRRGQRSGAGGRCWWQQQRCRRKQ